jgi:hypothetical protein
MDFYSLSRRIYLCIIFLFSPYVRYAVIDSGDREAYSYVGGFDLKDA